MFPNDNSVMFGTKFQVGNTEYFRYKVLKDGVVFGIKENSLFLPNFWALFDNGTMLNVEI